MDAFFLRFATPLPRFTDTAGGAPAPIAYAVA
jgi:hypothetical protein